MLLAFSKMIKIDAETYSENGKKTKNIFLHIKNILILIEIFSKVKPAAKNCPENSKNTT